jgi:hypothetical protein
VVERPLLRLRTTEEVPDQVAVQQSSPLGVVLAGEQVGEEGVETDHDLVAWWQGFDGDQRLAQVCQGLGLSQFVEGLVGQGYPAGGEVGQDGSDGRLGQPAHRGDGVFGGGDVAAESLQPGW